MRDSLSGKGHFHESYFAHPCLVATENDVLSTDIRGSGWRSSLRRWWHNWFLLSYSDSRCRVYYTSSHALRLERARHYRHYRGRIHPFSKFSNYWAAFILVVSLTNRLVFHHNTSITFGRLQPVSLILGMFLELILIIDLLVSFKIGYIDDHHHRVVLNSKKCVVHYCSTKLFFHVSSVLPLQVIMFFRFGLQDCKLCRGNKFVCCLQFLAVCSLWRMYKATEYWNRDRNSFKATYLYKLLRILVLAFFTMLQYLNLLDAVNVWKAINTQYVYEQSRFHIFMNLKKIPDLDNNIFNVSLQFSTIVKYLFSYGHYVVGEVYYLDTITGLLGFIMANLFKMWAFVEWYTVVHRKKSQEDHLESQTAMTMNLMKARQVSDEVTSRIKQYYDFVISKTRIVTKRNELYTLLPSSIVREMKLVNYYHLIRKIPYFENWPQEMLEHLTYLLKEEIYLEEDVVAPKWAQGEGLMILSAGVLSVYSKADEEVGHLIDGDYFGELSLVTDRELRTSSVVAASACEILILCKKAFRGYMRQHPLMFFQLREGMRNKFFEQSPMVTENMENPLEEREMKSERNQELDKMDPNVASSTKYLDDREEQRASSKPRRNSSDERNIEATSTGSSHRSRIRWGENENPSPHGNPQS